MKQESEIICDPANTKLLGLRKNLARWYTTVSCPEVEETLAIVLSEIEEQLRGEATTPLSRAAA